MKTRKKTSTIPKDRTTIAAMIPTTLWRALKLRQIRTGETREKLIEQSLAAFLVQETKEMGGVK